MDNKQFWKLLEPFHSQAAGFARKLAGDSARADDLYQETVLQALRKFGGLRDRNSFRPWFYRILVNRYRNSCRSWWFRRRSDSDGSRLEHEPQSDPRDRYEARRRLNELLNILSARDRALVVLHEIEGWSTAELAEIIGRPEGTVRTWLYRARRKMRKRLMRSLPQPTTDQLTGEKAYALLRSEKTTK